MKIKDNLGCSIYIVFHAIVGILIMWWTDYNLDWMFTQIYKTNTDIPFWISAVASILFSEIIFAFNLFVWILRLFL